jgi:hypothetical protein
MKKTVRAGRGLQAMEAALGLLERSVRMRHCRLAVQRLNAAVALGAQVPDEHWRYCREAAETSHDAKVRTLFTDSALAAQAASKGAPHG